jgi:hypothetical protein
VNGHVLDFRDTTAQGQEARYLRLPQSPVLGTPCGAIGPEPPVGSRSHQWPKTMVSEFCRQVRGGVLTIG